MLPSFSLQFVAMLNKQTEKAGILLAVVVVITWSKDVGFLESSYLVYYLAK